MYFYTYENLSCFMLCINIGAQRKLEKILKDAARKCREKYMDKFKESISNNAKKLW